MFQSGIEYHSVMETSPDTAVCGSSIKLSTIELDGSVLFASKIAIPL
jgi:hypothetical protein